MGLRTLRAVICDDDPLLRRVLGSVLTEHGYRVVGEADTADGARDLIEANTVDVVLVDLALNAGSGEELVKVIDSDHPEVTSVVFSAFVESAEDLLAAGAAAVFEKPDFEHLAQWLAERAAGPARGPSRGAERRRPTLPAPPLPDRGLRSPSGFEPWGTFKTAACRLWPGDAILVTDVLERDEWIRTGDPAVLADHRMTLGTLIAPSLRELDRIAIAPSGVVCTLLVATHPEAPSAVFKRLEGRWDNAGHRGTPIGSFCHIRPDVTAESSLARALHRVADPAMTAEFPLRLA